MYNVSEICTLVSKCFVEWCDIHCIKCFFFGSGNYTHLLYTLAQCPILDDLANGTLALTGISVGDTAHYTCLPDYELVGANNLTCGDDGQWSADLPVCRRKHIYNGTSIMS